jgi:hypothetical protein
MAQDAAQGGGVSIAATAGAAGLVPILSGASVGDGRAGSVEVGAGAAQSEAGSLSLFGSAVADGVGGGVSIASGRGTTSGKVIVGSADGTTESGSLTLETGTSAELSGSVSVRTGAATGLSGDIEVQTGTGGGSILLATGLSKDNESATAGNIDVVAGDARGEGGRAGHISVMAGHPLQPTLRVVRFRSKQLRRLVSALPLAQSRSGLALSWRATQAQSWFPLGQPRKVHRDP